MVWCVGVSSLLVLVFFCFAISSSSPAWDDLTSNEKVLTVT